MKKEIRIWFNPRIWKYEFNFSTNPATWIKGCIDLEGTKCGALDFFNLKSEDVVFTVS